MTSFNLDFKNTIKHRSSRADAEEPRQQILHLLEKYDTVKIDLEGTLLTPSIADGVIGAIAQELGKDTFKAKVKLINLNESQRSLLKHVIARRLLQHKRNHH